MSKFSKIILKFSLAIFLLAMFFQAGMTVGRKQGEINTRTEYLDSSMRADSIRWSKWDQDDERYRFQHDSIMEVFAESYRKSK